MDYKNLNKIIDKLCKLYKINKIVKFGSKYFHMKTYVELYKNIKDYEIYNKVPHKNRIDNINL